MTLPIMAAVISLSRKGAMTASDFLGGNGEDKPKALKTDQLIGQFNLGWFGDGSKLNDCTLAGVFHHNENSPQNSRIAHILSCLSQFPFSDEWQGFQTMKQLFRSLFWNWHPSSLQNDNLYRL